MIGRTSRQDFIHDGRNIARDSVNNGDVDRNVLAVFTVADGHRRAFHAVEPPDFFEFQRFQLVAGNHRVRRAQRRFHDAARVAENRARAGIIGQQRPAFHLFFGCQIDAELFEKSRQVPRCQHRIHIGIGRAGGLAFFAVVFIGADEFGTRGLQFLGRAGHDPHRINPVSRFVPYFDSVCLGDGSGHLLRRFGR